MDDYQTMERRGVSTSTISAFYDDRFEAEQAVERLRISGVPDLNIRLTEGHRPDVAAVDPATDDRGFFEMLGDFFFPPEDRSAYAEGLSRGGYLVVATDLTEDLYDTALDILDDEGAVDIEERSALWRAEGWTGSYDDLPGSTALRGTGISDDDDEITDAGLGDGRPALYQRDTLTSHEAEMTPEFGTDGDEDRARRGETSPTAAAMASAASGVLPGSTGGRRAPPHEAQMMTEADIHPVTEERCRFGTRDTSHGRSRVRSYLMDDEERPIDDALNEDMPQERDINRP